ncbi:glycoside hydrolase family 108 protein [Sorangium sp. So ce1389]|uniref:glycoside hydrolase family 108 protein n=1 Tax=Sorangium sp. So ce1389 TaxID=3133336 RepID=UPI003F5E3F28
MTSNPRFDACLEFLLKWEGGFSDHPADPGRATCMGITQRTYDGHCARRGRARRSVRGITRDEAIEIYAELFWAPLQCDRVSPPLDLVVFDTGVNMGTSRAVKLLQASLGVAVDGVLGPQTLGALEAQRAPLPALVSDYLARRGGHYRALVARRPSLGVFLGGWLNRLEDLEAAALTSISPPL